MTEAQTHRTQNAAGPKLGSPTLKQPSFNWEALDKYTELKTFKLEVNNILSTYSTPEAEKLVVVKKLAREKRDPLFRNTNANRKRSMQRARWFV